MSENKSAEVAVPQMHYFTKIARHDTYDRISPTQPGLSARDKNVVVTGGGAGIGKAIAIAFAQAGAKSVAILGRREARLQSALKELQTAASSSSTVFKYEVCDLMKKEEVEKAFESIVTAVGRTDILISNAGALPDIGPVRALDTVQFMHGFNMNVLSALNILQAFLPRATSHPMIISVSSCIAHMSPMPNVSGYAVSKAANLKLFDYVAAENPNIHVVNLQPGTVQTEMAEKAGVTGTTKIALPANFCVWLTSPEAAFLKSKFVWANWDVDELVSRKEEITNSRLFTWLLDGVPM